MKQSYLFAILFLFASNLLFAQSRNNVNYWDVMQDVSLKAKFNPITVVNLLSEKRGYSIKGVPQQVKSLQVTKPIRRKITLNLNYSMAFH